MKEGKLDPGQFLNSRLGPTETSSWKSSICVMSCKIHVWTSQVWIYYSPTRTNTVSGFETHTFYLNPEHPRATAFTLCFLKHRMFSSGHTSSVNSNGGRRGSCSVLTTNLCWERVQGQEPQARESIHHPSQVIHHQQQALCCPRC